MSDAESQFAAENGMSSEDAWNYILRWHEEGKIEQVRRGCEELLKFFPDHQGAHQVLEATNRPAPQSAEGQHAEDVPQPTNEQPDHPGKKSMMDGLLGKFQGAVNEQRQKLQEMNPPQPKDPRKQAHAQGLPGVAQPDDSEKLMAAACYLYIFVIIPLLIKRDSQYVQFHAWQGVVLTAGVIAGNMVLRIVTSPFHMGAGLGLGFLAVFETIVRLVVVALYLWAMYNAYRGKWLRLPLIYPFAQKFHNAVK